MKIGDLVEEYRTGTWPTRPTVVDLEGLVEDHSPRVRGIITNLSDCETMAWVAWPHLGMKEIRIPTRFLKVIA
jgi:hypothetical protein